MKQRIYFYRNDTDDLVQSKDQGRQLPEDYVWIRTDRFALFWNRLLYPVARAFAFFYCRIILRMRIVNRHLLRDVPKEKGVFLYCNHTQPIGDVFTPVLLCGKKHPYIIASPANLGIPVIGRLLPILGILPIPQDAARMRLFLDAVKKRAAAGHCIVVYPEAHVWPYFTGIRPYAATSFQFPVQNDAPVYVATSTYQKRRLGKKPKTTVYVDGPFFPEKGIPKGAVKQKLRDEVLECMKERSKQSTYEYIRYEKIEKE